MKKIIAAVLMLVAFSVQAETMTCSRQNETFDADIGVGIDEAQVSIAGHTFVLPRETDSANTFFADGNRLVQINIFGRNITNIVVGFKKAPPNVTDFIDLMNFYMIQRIYYCVHHQ